MFTSGFFGEKERECQESRDLERDQNHSLDPCLAMASSHGMWRGRARLNKEMVMLSAFSRLTETKTGQLFLRESILATGLQV